MHGEGGVRQAGGAQREDQRREDLGLHQPSQQATQLHVMSTLIHHSNLLFPFIIRSPHLNGGATRKSRKVLITDIPGPTVNGFHLKTLNNDDNTYSGSNGGGVHHHVRGYDEADM